MSEVSQETMMFKRQPETLDVAATIKEVYAALDSDKERELFVRIVEEKLDYRSLSEEYGVTSGNLRVILSRFRSKLRKIVNNILTD